MRLELRHMERNVTGDRGEIPIIVPTAAALGDLAVFIADRLHQGMGLLFQRFIQSFFYAAAEQVP